MEGPLNPRSLRCPRCKWADDNVSSDLIVAHDGLSASARPRPSGACPALLDAQPSIRSRRSDLRADAVVERAVVMDDPPPAGRRRASPIQRRAPALFADCGGGHADGTYERRLRVYFHPAWLIVDDCGLRE